MLTLADLKINQTAVILDIRGDDSIAVRLMEMGLTEGESVRLVGAAPLGDPLEILVRGYKLSMRRLEAARIHVEPSPTPSAPTSS